VKSTKLTTGSYRLIVARLRDQTLLDGIAELIERLNALKAALAWKERAALLSHHALPRNQITGVAK
jgi:hypothetical protein